MIRINLLPYREARRSRQQQQFLLAAMGVVLLAALLFYGVYRYFGQRVDGEAEKVAYLHSVTQDLDHRISSIADLRKRRDALLAREKIIAELQQKRDQTVRIFNTLAGITPQGVFLTKLQQDGQIINLNGYAEGNDQVAAFMRSIESSHVFANPTLDIISKAQLGSDQVGQFTLQVQIASVTANTQSTRTTP